MSQQSEPVREVDLEQIYLDPDLRVRDSTDDATVEEYAEAWKSGAKFPPVDVFDDGTVYRVADGLHRVLAARKAGVKTVQAVVHQGSARDAFLFAAKCNATHGLRRTNRDKHLVVNKILQDPEWSKKSSRWIADACAVSHTFVQNVRSELATVASSGVVECRDGKQRPVTFTPNQIDDRVPRRLADMSIEKRQDLFINWWDQLGKYAVLLDAVGWHDDKIARFLGMRLEEDVRPILNPRPPLRQIEEFRDISQKPDQLAKAYKDAVDYCICFLVGNRFGSAAEAATDEGFPELRERLAERQRRETVRAEQLRSSVCTDPSAESWWKETLCVDFCAKLDARYALGIEISPKWIQLAQSPFKVRFDEVMRMINDLHLDGMSAIDRIAALTRKFLESP